MGHSGGESNAELGRQAAEAAVLLTARLSFPLVLSGGHAMLLREHK